MAGPHRLAKEEVSRQELRQRVRMADNEVMDAFRKIMAARQKKRTPTKKEKDQAWKTLKERESILKLLDGELSPLLRPPSPGLGQEAHFLRASRSLACGCLASVKWQQSLEAGPFPDMFWRNCTART